MIGMRAARGELLRIVEGTPSGAPFAFQYNPEHLQRRFVRVSTAIELDVRGLGKAVILPGTIDETVRLELVLDATDLPEQTGGVRAELDALAELVREPWLLLRWGPNRAVALQVVAAEIYEHLFDRELNPLRVAVTLEARNVQPHFPAMVGPIIARALTR